MDEQQLLTSPFWLRSSMWILCYMHYYHIIHQFIRCGWSQISLITVITAATTKWRHRTFSKWAATIKYFWEINCCVLFSFGQRLGRLRNSFFFFVCVCCGWGSNCSVNNLTWPSHQTLRAVKHISGIPFGPRRRTGSAGGPSSVPDSARMPPRGWPLMGGRGGRGGRRESRQVWVIGSEDSRARGTSSKWLSGCWRGEMGDGGGRLEMGDGDGGDWAAAGWGQRWKRMMGWCRWGGGCEGEDVWHRLFQSFFQSASS